MDTIERLASEISSCGVRRCFGVPGGGTSLALLDHLQKMGVGFHLAHTEAAAAIYAGAWGMLSGLPGICVSIKGPGLTNALPGLAVARFEDYPLVAITEAFAPTDPPTKAHKRIDHQALTQALVKAHCYLDADGPAFGRLMDIARAENPGPVLLNLSAGPTTVYQDPRDAVHGGGAAIDLPPFSRPVVIAGSLAGRSAFSDILNALAFPVFTTAAAKGVVNECLPHAAGVYTGAGKELSPEAGIIGKADLIVGIGLRAKEVLAVNRFHCTAVNIDVSSTAAETGGFGFAGTMTLAEGKEFLGEAGKMTWGLELVEQSRAALMGGVDCDAYLPVRVLLELPGLLGRRFRLVVDTGDFNTIAEHVHRASTLHDYLSTANSRYMGTALPLGIAASMHAPELPHVVVVGDGGMGWHASELKTAVAQKLPMLILLFSDGGFGSIRGRAKQLHLTLDPLTVADPAWAGIVRGFGIPSAVAATYGEFEAFVRSWRPAEGPGFVELRFSPEAYEAMTRRLR